MRTQEKQISKKQTEKKHSASKHTAHTYKATKRRTLLPLKKKRQLKRLCFKCVLCTSVFTLTLLASSGWDIANPRSDSWKRYFTNQTALFSPSADSQQPSYKNALADSRASEKNSNTANVPDRSSSKKPAGSDSQDSQTNAASGGQDGEADADENDASYDNDGQAPDSVLDTEGSPSSYPEYDAEKSARYPNTDEQTRYPSASDPDDTFYYSDTDNQMRFSANTGSSLPSIPEQLPVERLVDTTTDDTDIPHYIQFSSAWNLILVNSWNKLPDSYEVRLTSLANGHFIDSRCYPALTQMMADCRSAGLDPLICSSYRSMEKQRSLFQERTDELVAQGYSKKDARTKAATSVARPGTSEHQAGLAVDIVDSSHQILDATQQDTPVQQWLMENSWKYGFILRYPNDKSSLTGIIYEPWHYRYVGIEAAAEIYEREICLEEYLERLELEYE